MNGRRNSEDRMRSTGVTRRRPRVLIIDDDERLRDVLALVLSDDCEVTLAASGAEAFEHLARSPFDVIVCDLSMPRMSGAQIHAALTEQDPDAAARMVIVTGGAYSNASEEFLRRSGCPQVPKPFTPTELMGAIHEILLRRGPAPLRKAC